MYSTNKIALVTGCGPGGIGQALAREFRSNGYTVIATLLPHEDRAHLEKHGILCINLDIRKDESIIELVVEVQKISNGSLDVLVNNAGIAYTMPATDTEVSEVEKMFAVNVFGPMRMIRHFHPFLIKAKGTVVNIGSIGGVIPYVYGASYNASKAALVHYGNTLRIEMKPFGVKVINVISGEVSTNILKSDLDRKLPQDSPYLPLSEEFRKHVNRTPVGAMKPEEYARGVVAMVMKKSPPAWFWFGTHTFTVRWLDALGWRTIWDSMLWKMFDLGKLVHGKTE